MTLWLARAKQNEADRAAKWEAKQAARAAKRADDALNDFNYVGSRFHYVGGRMSTNRTQRVTGDSTAVGWTDFSAMTLVYDEIESRLR